MTGPRLLLSLALGATLAAHSAAALAQSAQVPLTVLFDPGELRASGALDASGRAHRDLELTLPAGATLELTVLSRDFDATAAVRGPDGFHVENDDGYAAGTDAHLTFVTPAAGRYVFTASTYAPGSFGGYLLLVQQHLDPALLPPAALPAPAAPAAPEPPPSLEPAPMPSFEPPAVLVPADPPPSPTRAPAAGTEREPGPVAEPGSGRLFGLFVGISHYPSNSPIFRGAEDAQDLALALEQHQHLRRDDAVVLTNDDATRGGVLHGLTMLTSRMRAQDTLLVYFGGHGGEGELEAFDGGVTAPELEQSLAHVPGTAVLALDTCHAGSFRSVIDGHPRRVGFFSSRAEQTSYTAEEVHASGWLIYFLLEAARGNADAGPDGLLQARELAQYVRAGYREHHPPQHFVFRAGPGERDATLW